MSTTTATTVAAAPVAARAVPRSISFGLGSGAMLQALNSSMIAVAIVGIAAHFGSTSGIAWVISGLYIATAVTSPVAGTLAARIGPRKVYLAGLVLIAVGAVLGAMAPTLGWLIFARILLGIGTSSQYPAAITIVRMIADRRGGQTGSALAVLNVCSQAMVALGPTVGGVLVGLFGWQSIMWVNLPLVLMTAVWVLSVVPKDPVGASGAGGLRSARARRDFLRSLDPVGMLAFLGVITATMFFLLSLTTDPLWPLVPVLAGLTAAFVRWELRVPAPFIDVRTVARNRALCLTLGRTLLTYTAFYCVFFGLPQWLQGARGFSAGTAGLLMLPIAGVGIGATILATRLYGARGARPVLFVGTLGLTVGGLALVFLGSTSTPVVVLVLVACVLGIPNGFNNMGNQNVINAVTGVREVGTALGMYRTVQYIGANLAAVVIELTTRGVVGDEGLHRLGAVIAVIGVVLLVGVIGSRTLRMPAPVLDAGARVRAGSEA